MFQFTRPLDLYLIDKIFDPLAAFCHKVWGLSNFTLAKWFLTLTTGTMLGTLYYRTIDAEPRGRFSFSLLVLIVFLWAFRGFRTAHRLEGEYLNPRSDKLPPNLRDNEHDLDVRSRRAILGLLTVLGLIESLNFALDRNHFKTHHLYDLLLFLSWVFSLIGFMFLGCTPRMRRKDEKPVTAKLETASAST